MSLKRPLNDKAPGPPMKLEAVQLKQESWSDEESEQASAADAGDERSAHCEEEPLIEERIVSFFEDRPHFYDLTHASYKNKQRRNFELAEFACVLGHGWTPEKLWKRFVSLRTDYGKLLKMIRQSKSGSGVKKLTPKQQWKLRRMQFLEPHRKNAAVCGEEELGNVPAAPAGETSEAEEGSDADDSLNKDDGVRGRKSQPQKIDSSAIATVLNEFLQAERGREEEIRDRARLVDERTTWSSWFASACANVPVERFREFQGETFSLLMRYLNPPTVPVAPPQQYQPLQQQQQQYQRAYVQQPDSSYNITVVGEPAHSRPTSSSLLSGIRQHQHSNLQEQQLDHGPGSSYNISPYSMSGLGTNIKRE
ncbi:uncharacterized protein LOC112145660 [Oryzias melastigma]|uniref:uncharacterized protein LOC112145660 n=1 Tax=Oryzias melastigma TaxID=30732 RepID=UPI000CF7E019|nr:uncharacterized protein LOC112145660 [Oryzias melastigma]